MTNVTHRPDPEVITRIAGRHQARVSRQLQPDLRKLLHGGYADAAVNDLAETATEFNVLHGPPGDGARMVLAAVRERHSSSAGPRGLWIDHITPQSGLAPVPVPDSGHVLYVPDVNRWLETIGTDGQHHLRMLLAAGHVHRIYGVSHDPAALPVGADQPMHGSIRTISTPTTSPAVFVGVMRDRTPLATRRWGIAALHAITRLAGLRLGALYDFAEQHPQAPADASPTSIAAEFAQTLADQQTPRVEGYIRSFTSADDQRIIRAFHSADVQTPKDLHEATGRPLVRIHDRLRELEAGGVLERAPTAGTTAPRRLRDPLLRLVVAGPSHRNRLAHRAVVDTADHAADAASRSAPPKRSDGRVRHDHATLEALERLAKSPTDDTADAAAPLLVALRGCLRLGLVNDDDALDVLRVAIEASDNTSSRTVYAAIARRAFRGDMLAALQKAV